MVPMAALSSVSALLATIRNMPQLNTEMKATIGVLLRVDAATTATVCLDITTMSDATLSVVQGATGKLSDVTAS
jgi:hypothetical protein